VDRRKIDCVISSMLIVVAITILTSNNLVEGGVESSLGSMTLPRIVAAMMLIMTLIIGGQALWSILKSAKSDEDVVETKGLLNVSLYIASFAIYWWLMPIFGFLICTPVMMLAIAALLACENWRAMIMLSVIVPFIIFYGSRHFLHVYLPTFNLS